MTQSIKNNVDTVFKNVQDACCKANREFSSVIVLVATKTVSPSRIQELGSTGVKVIAENKVQEFISKVDAVMGFDWHFIGSLQTNKVKYIIDKVKLIHSVDRESLVDEIDKQAKKHNLTMDILLQINAGDEESKSGASASELSRLYNYAKTKSNINVVGFMPVLPIDAQDGLYKKMEQIFNHYKSIDSNIKHLSMGMSDDYAKAIEYSSTIVRVGSCIFGQRVYA